MSLISEILRFTKEGIYCPKGDFWIDPSRKKNIALITHAHMDHATRGHNRFVAQKQTASLLKLFFGAKINVTELEYADSVEINGVKVSFFPAGHVLGSSQILLEYEGLRVVVAGDYKVEDDRTVLPFHPVKCDVFVTESTFAKPHYIWAPQHEVMQDINTWWKINRSQGITSILLAYSLGKSQRLLKNVDSSIGDIFVGEQIGRINGVYTESGITLPEVHIIEPWMNRSKVDGSLVIVPSLSMFLNLRELPEMDVRRVSGWVVDAWMGIQGFAMSDHADWIGLNEAVKASGAERIYVQHGFTSYYTKYLKDQGYDAFDVKQCIKRGTELELF